MQTQFAFSNDEARESLISNLKSTLNQLKIVHYEDSFDPDCANLHV